MKRPIFLLLLMSMIGLFVVACGNSIEKYENDESRWNKTEHNKVDDFTGVTMTVRGDSLSPDGLVVIFENESVNTAVYSDDFLIEKNVAGDWREVPVKLEEYGFNDIGYDLNPDEINEFAVEWDWLYGSLDEGEYRIIKSVLNFRGTGDFDKHYLSTEFSLEK